MFFVGVAFFFDDPEASNPDFRAVITERQIDIENESTWPINVAVDLYLYVIGYFHSPSKFSLFSEEESAFPWGKTCDCMRKAVFLEVKQILPLKRALIFQFFQVRVRQKKRNT